jgi:hypothetical protein
MSGPVDRAHDVEVDHRPLGPNQEVAVEHQPSPDQLALLELVRLLPASPPLGNGNPGRTESDPSTDAPSLAASTRAPGRDEEMASDLGDLSTPEWAVVVDLLRHRSRRAHPSNPCVESLWVANAMRPYRVVRRTSTAPPRR